MNTILVATDFSEYSTSAVQQAANIARHVRAEIVLVHSGYVSGEHPEQYRQAPGHSEPWKRVLEHELITSRHRLEAIEQQIGATGVRASHRIVDGAPVEAICDAAEEVGADLVVLGSHGRTGSRRVFLGSVAERVTRLCPTSVLVARGGDLGAGGYQRVLVATDFDDPADVALGQACELTAPGGGVDLVHFWHLPPLAGDLHGEPTSVSVYESVERSIRDSAERRGRELVERHRQRERDISFEAIGAAAIAGIQKKIEQDPGRYDLVAVGTHGRRGLKRLLLGSVAEATVRYSPCSVLVSRAGR